MTENLNEKNWRAEEFLIYEDMSTTLLLFMFETIQ
jgi:hypothetical protein